MQASAGTPAACGAQAATGAGAGARRNGEGNGDCGRGMTGGATKVAGGRTMPSARARAARAAASGTGARLTTGAGSAGGFGMAAGTGTGTGAATATGGAGVSHTVASRTALWPPLPSTRYRCTWPALIACRVPTWTKRRPPRSTWLIVKVCKAASMMMPPPW